VSKAYPTKCPDCKRDVFFFSCSCGSKIFFEDLGYPWEQHNCKRYSIRKQIELIQSAESLSTDEIWKKISDHQTRTGFLMDDSMIKMIEEIIGPRKYEFKAKNVSPIDYITVQGKKVDLSGKVIEVNNPINLAKYLGYSKTIMGEKLLNQIGDGPWLRIVLRTRVNKKNECLEFDLLLRHEQWKKARIAVSNAIYGIAERRSHPKGFFWFLEEYNVI
jgi:hypothetical protein